MPLQTMQQGIDAINAGNKDEGRRLLRIALNNETIQGELRAIGLMWLAETTDDRAQKIQYYQEAIAADPKSNDARVRLALLLQPPPPPAPAQTQTSTGVYPITDTGPLTPYSPQQGGAPGGGAQGGANWSGYTPQTNPYTVTSAAQPYNTPYGVPVQPSSYTPNANPYAGAGQPPMIGNFTTIPTSTTLYRAVGIVGGPNGVGSGFFVTLDGLIATTRFVVGSVENLMIELEAGLNVPGRVVRGFPEFDLALIRANIQLKELLRPTPLPAVQENAVLNAVSYNGRAMSGTRRETRRELRAEWIPTTIDRLSIVDAGGNPVFDDHNYLIGMLTRNTSRTSNYAYALHIQPIHAAVQTYLYEIQVDPRRAYCPCCGFASRAPSVGGFYCEGCGAVLPYATDAQRFPNPQTMALYGDTSPIACPSCKARAGFYNNKCLRCGASNKPLARAARL